MNTLVFVCLYNLKLYEEAKSNFEKVHALRVETLGESHIDTLYTLYWYKFGLRN